MAVSVGYVVRETASNLLRNRLMALAAILTVAVSLSLVGTALLLKQAVSNQVGVWSSNVSLEVFTQPGATSAQTASISESLKSSPQIAACTYLDHQQSYDLMKKLLSSNPLAVSAVTPAETPPVFQCRLTNPNEAATVAATFGGQAGVYKVAYPAESIRVMQEVTSVIQKILLGIALVLMISSLVLILNAIRMAIFARRREVGVMKLVGATDWFIRVPFMLEGLVQGLLGAIVAAGIVVLANYQVRDLVSRYKVSALSSAVVPGHEVVMTEILVIVAGAVVGTLGSVIAVRKFLDV